MIKWRSITKTMNTMIILIQLTRETIFRIIKTQRKSRFHKPLTV